VRGGFGGGMQPVLGHFMDAARRRLDALAIEMVERNAPFADGVTLLDGFRDVGFGQRGRFEQRTAGSELRCERGRKGAAGAMRVFDLYLVGREVSHFPAFEQDVHSAVQMTTFHDHGMRFPYPPDL